MQRNPRASAPALPILLGALGLALAALPAAAADPDWAALAAEETVEVVTTDEDGSARETTIWLIVLDGQAYIRTGGSSWGDNLVRKPELTLRSGDAEYPLRVEFIEDDALRHRIENALREKYGFSDWMISFFRGGRPKMMRLDPR